MTTATKLNAIYDPTEAAAWLLARHDSAAHLVGRIDAWFPPDEGEKILYPDLESIAHGINAADQLGAEWEAYRRRHPAPSDHRAYAEWERQGPTTGNVAAKLYGPMSSGEKRALRMLAVLTPSGRVRFALGDTDGISLACCYASGRLVHRSFVDDWCDLISGRVVRP